MAKRPDFIFHWKDHLVEDVFSYPGSDEPLSYGAEFTSKIGLTRLGLGVDVIKPHQRCSWPHAHESEEEFVFILEGTPDIWVDGEIFRLAPGDCAGFPARTGIAHTIINNTDTDVIFFVVGEREKMMNTRIRYPLHPARNAEIGDRHWKEMEGRPLGPHDGKPDALREREA